MAAGTNLMDVCCLGAYVLGLDRSHVHDPGRFVEVSFSEIQVRLLRGDSDAALRV